MDDQHALQVAYQKLSSDWVIADFCSDHKEEYQKFEELLDKNYQRKDAEAQLSKDEVLKEFHQLNGPLDVHGSIKVFKFFIDAPSRIVSEKVFIDSIDSDPDGYPQSILVFDPNEHLLSRYDYKIEEIQLSGEGLDYLSHSQAE